MTIKSFLILFFLGVTFTPDLFAAELAPLSRQSMRGGFDVLKLQGPDSTRRERYSFNTSYHYFFTDSLRAEGYLLVSPDDLKKSGKVDINTDYYQVLPAIAWTYPYLFRYAFAFGPSLIWGRTSYHLNDQRESFSFFDSSANGRFSVEYAFDSRFELNATVGTQYRFAEQRLDWSYGSSLAVYF